MHHLSCFGYCLLLLACTSDNNITNKPKVLAETLLDESKVESKLELPSHLDLMDSVISNAIKEIYDLESVKFKDCLWYDESDFEKLFGIAKVSSSYEFGRFVLFQFDSQEVSSNAFNNIKKMAEELKNQRKYPEDVELIFSKGGKTYILAEQFILTHALRCNMTKREYQLDKELALKIAEQTKKSSWLRSHCGWGKMEISSEN